MDLVGRVTEFVDVADLKSAANITAYGFDSRPGHQFIKKPERVLRFRFFFIYCFANKFFLPALHALSLSAACHVYFYYCSVSDCDHFSFVEV